MVGNISAVFTEYEERVRRLQKVPRFSHGRRMVRSDVAPNRTFFHSLFNDHTMANEFLQDIGLIQSLHLRNQVWILFIAIIFRFRLCAYFHYHVPIIIRSPVIIFRLEF
jgi:hypothetical protein